MPGDLQIAAVAIDDGAVGNYRVKGPLKELHNKRKAEVWTTEHEKLSVDGLGMFGKIMPHVDVLVFQRPHFPGVINLMEFMKNDKDQLVVFECDDELWSTHPLSPHYREMGLKEFYLTVDEARAMGVPEKDIKKNKKGNKFYIHRDGKNGFNIEKNKERLHNYARALSSAHLITTTNPILADRFAEVAQEYGNKNPVVAVLPNCLDLKRWKPVEIVMPTDEIRILWQGGSSHYYDLLSVIKPLQEVLKKYPNVKLVLSGQSFPGIEKAFPKNQVISDAYWTHFDAHSYRTALQGADIGICPLVDNPFNRCKSDIKFTEYSALKMAVVAADIPPYSPSIEHGKTGFLAKNQDEWVKHLSALVENEKLRKTTGENARKWVEEHRNLEKSAGLWIDAYNKAIENK